MIITKVTCDWDACDAWQRDPDRTMITVHQDNSLDNHFCSMEHLSMWARSIVVSRDSATL